MKEKSIRAGHHRHAFTLIELLVVIAIIALLAAILFPIFGRARENARRATCQSNLKQIGLGIYQYIADYDERYPPYQSSHINAANSSWVSDGSPEWYSTAYGNGHGPLWWQHTFPYTKSLQIMICPSHSKVRGITSTTNAPYPSGSPGYTVYPSYGININYTVQRRDPVNFPAGWYGLKQGQVTRPAEKILVTELRVSMLPESVGTLATIGTYGAGWGEPAINDGDFTGGSAAQNSWYTSDPSATANSRHFEGCNFLFADGHVKYLPGKTEGLMYTQLSSPSTNPLARHWWDPVYDG